MKAVGVGRNALCPCGSGKKFKQCCQIKQQRMSLPMRIALIAVGAALVAGLAFGISSYLSSSGTGPRGVWSPEHGHYH